MNPNVEKILLDTISRHPQLSLVESELRDVFVAISDAFKSGGKLLVCGNGGSASDADHIVGELMKGFMQKRPIEATLKDRFLEAGIGSEIVDKLQRGLPSINLAAQNALLTATINDLSGDVIYAQQLIGYGTPGDILLGISTSGNSKNIILAGQVAKVLGLLTVGLTGQAGGMMNEAYDLMIRVPESATYKVQELHLPVYHTLCAMLEEEFFGC